MKGAKTRLNLMDALSMPKDRLQLAQELGLDWKAVDYHIVLLNRYGLVHEDRAFGNVRLYKLTKQGEVLLQLLKDFEKETPTGTEPVDGGITSTSPLR
jgi:DNA-binding transcriptional ArsR family regulator